MTEDFKIFFSDVCTLYHVDKNKKVERHIVLNSMIFKAEENVFSEKGDVLKKDILKVTILQEQLPTFLIKLGDFLVLGDAPIISTEDDYINLRREKGKIWRITRVEYCLNAPWLKHIQLLLS